MIEEPGRVVALEPGAVWVETLPRSGCGRCDEPGGCGRSTASSRRRTAHVLALTDETLAVGDEVLVAIPAHALLRSALLVYVLPILVLVAAAVLGNRLLPGDAGTALGLAAGLLAGFVLIRRLSTRTARDPAVHPVVIRRMVRPAACPPA